MMILGAFGSGRKTDSLAEQLTDHAMIHLVSCLMTATSYLYATFGYKGFDFTYSASIKDTLFMLSMVYITFSQVLWALHSVIKKRKAVLGRDSELPVHQSGKEGHHMLQLNTFFFVMGLIFGASFLIAIAQLQSLVLFTYLYGWNFKFLDNLFMTFFPLLSCVVSLSCVVVLVTRFLFQAIDSRTDTPSIYSSLDRILMSVANLRPRDQKLVIKFAKNSTPWTDCSIRVCHDFPQNELEQKNKAQRYQMEYTAHIRSEGL